MKELLKYLVLFCIGGGIYVGIEFLFRQRSYVSMFVIGGVCFILCGALNEIIPWEMPLPEQMLICCLIITTVELAAGIILNEWLGLGIWDYSNMPLNYRGQICLPFSVGWYFLSVVGIVLDDYLRYWIFHEEKPHYTLRRMRC